MATSNTIPIGNALRKGLAEGWAVLLEEPGIFRVILPFQNQEEKQLYFFITVSKKRFSLLLPVESAGLIAVKSTLAILQPMLKTYGLILTSEAVIMEVNHKLPLHKRIHNMSQAIINMDGVRRLWKSQLRREDAQGKAVEPTSYSADDRPSR